MNLCNNCKHRTSGTNGSECAIRASASALLEQGRSVASCEGFEDQRGRRLIVDHDGGLGRR